MCGICGMWHLGLDHGGFASILPKMADSIVHRGPDDSGIWYDQEAGIGLAHRRLAILDISDEGHQPMQSASGRYVLVYNGEIYNFQSIREELRHLGYLFRGGSDTEVALAAIEYWGITEAVLKFSGMFAFAVWDRQEKTLYLVRDRVGEKPLYYGWGKNCLLFASELKAFHANTHWQAQVDRNSLSLFLQFNYVPTPYSIFKNVYKLPPGSFISFRSHRMPESFSPHSSEVNNGGSPVMYWSLKKIVESGTKNTFSYSPVQAIDALDDLLRCAVQRQMVADVPLGAFLSGGIDSSTIVALMQSQSNYPVKTFTIGFQEQNYNEAEFAKRVAVHLGTEHTELYVTSEQTREIIPRLPTLYDEPFADSSQIPTYLISDLARRAVTVSLSGDGGDELFSGYNRYVWGENIWGTVGKLPFFLRRVMAHAVKQLTPARWDLLYSTFLPFIPAKWKIAHPGDRIHKLADVMDARTPEEMYGNLISFWKRSVDVVIGGAAGHNIILNEPENWPQLDDFILWMMFLDISMYLPDDILVKVDRAAMGVSLETRVPFLDHKVVEFAWRLPLALKMRENQGKWILRQVLYKYVPRELIERPKMGFAIPIDVWLRGPLKDWAEDLLSEKKLAADGFFEPWLIRQKWQEHLSGKRNWQYLLWNILMFQAWNDCWQQ